jgi:hypothetical protein
MRLSGDDPNDLLGAMFECLASGPSVYLPSNYWTALNRKALALLATEGFKNFKRTIAQDYFTWIVGRRDPQFKFLFSHTHPLDWMGILDGAWRRDLSLPLRWRAQTQFAIFSKMLWRYAERHDPEHLLARIHEPLLGNPFNLHPDGRLISQDLAIPVLNTILFGRDSPSQRIGTQLSVNLARATAGQHILFFPFNLPVDTLSWTFHLHCSWLRLSEFDIFRSQDIPVSSVSQFR